jgi:hypothetical protein
MLENDTLKEVESQFPGVFVKAIHDDIALGGRASDIFGPNGHGGALESLMTKLKDDCGLTMKALRWRSARAASSSVKTL